MNRIALGAVTALSVWFGSALAAEAQAITPTGPMTIQSGSTSATFTATVSIPTSTYFYVKVNVVHNGVNIHSSTTYVPNPGTTTYNFSKLCAFNTAVNTSSTVDFYACLTYMGRNYQAAPPNYPFEATVTGTRPTSKTFQNRSILAIVGADKDRRKE